MNSIAASILLTSLSEVAAFLWREIEKITGFVARVGEARGRVSIAAKQNVRFKALVDGAALTPEEGDTAADVFEHTCSGGITGLSAESIGALWSCW